MTHGYDEPCQQEVQGLLYISFTLMERSSQERPGRWAGASPPPSGHAQLCRPLRFETLEPEMNALAARITAVNDIAEQLLKANPPGKDSIVSTQRQLNHR